MATIGISGSYGGLNIGDEAILASILASLRAARPADELVVFSRNAAHTRRERDVDRVVDVRGLSRDEVLPEVERLDLLLVGGGGILYDSEARIFLREARMAQELAIPTAAFAVGVGPLDDPYDRAAVIEALNNMNVVAVRDELSKRVLEDIGVRRRIEVTADPALLLEPEPFTEEMLRAEGIDGDARLVGMSVREPGKAASDLDEDAYHTLLAYAADFVVYRFNADIVFVPMERSDVRHSHAVISRMVAADRTHVLKRDYRPRQMLGLMEHIDVVVGMRLHLLIFAAISAVPFLALPYAGKVFAFADAVGFPPPAPVHRESAGPLLAEIDRLWDDRERRAQQLRERVPALRERTERTLQAAVRLLDNNTSGVL